MIPTRPAFWNVEGLVVFMYLVTAAETAVFGYGVYRSLRAWRRGQGAIAFDRPWERLRRAAAMTLGHRGLIRDRISGTAHFSFFWGFLLLGVGTIVAMADEEFHIPIMRGDFYLIFQSFVLDVAGVAASLGLIVVLVRRATHAPRLVDPPGRNRQWFDLFLLCAFLLILISGYLIEGLRIAATRDEWAAWSPLGGAIASGALALGLSEASMRSVHAALWSGHLVLASAFVALIPYTKLLHMLTAPLNAFFAPLGVTLPTRIDFERAETFGLATPAQLTVGQRVEVEACTECGRCQDACPAYAVGQPLSPKALIVDLRDSARTGALHPPVHAGRREVTESEPLPQLIAAVTPDALWSCVTCLACVQECPVVIGHVPLIVDMRRHLVMERAEYPERLQEAIGSIEDRGTPYRGAKATRTEWSQDLGVRTMAEVRSAEYLYWVGCASAFDERGQRVARAFARLLQRAGVDFAILGDEETCTGDPARQIGNEYVAQQCGRKNVETLSRYEFRKIVTTCPHCFNTLLNVYPELEGRYDVVHHTELLAELVASGRLAPRAENEVVATYHDPCYLGRYNGRYDAPRRALAAVPGLSLVEMEKHREKSFCCGGGGGHMWTEEISGGRINQRRTEHAIATGASTIVTACPFCAVMFEDGVRASGQDERLAVRDMAELLDDATAPRAGA